jgi:hypothetical protein
MEENGNSIEKSRRIGPNQTHHINQDIQRTPTPLLNQFSSIMLLPLILLIIAEVTLERLLAPGAVRRVRDRRERRDGLVLARVAKELMNWLDKTLHKTSYFPAFVP